MSRHVCYIFMALATLFSVPASRAADPPALVSVIPTPGTTVRSLVQIEVIFTEDVTGVQPTDLEINGVGAASVDVFNASQYVFNFPQPAPGLVQIAWNLDNQIHDFASPANPFPGTNMWTYVLDTNLVDNLLINEFMASNKKTLHDEDGDSSDWIEIYNPTAAPVNLGGWYLTDTTTNLAEWRFPDGLSLGANAYLVVFASGKDRTNIAGKYLHTNFQLSSGGEYLALVDPAGSVISDFSPAFPPQQTDVSYGRDRANPSIVGYFPVPTPKAANSTSGPGFAPDVQFSVTGRTFAVSAPLSVILSTISPGAVIHYVLGTNVPGTNSPIYTGPISITNTTYLRARAFQTGLFPGPVHSETYLGLAPSVLNFNSDLPLIILHNLGGGPVPSSADQFVMLQTFETKNGRSSLTNTPDLAIQAHFHLRGSSTLGYPKGSFFLQTDDEFRNDQKVPLLGLPQESDWVLYAPNNFEPVLMHNPMAHELSREAGRYSSRTRFVEVFLSTAGGAITTNGASFGNYNGIYVLEEKIKISKDRVGIDKLQVENTTAPSVTGGYLLSIDRAQTPQAGFSTPNIGTVPAQTINFLEPKNTEILTPPWAPQKNYAISYFSNFVSALAGPNYTNATNGYAAYIDVDAWIDHHVLNVVTFNVDALRLSGYFYKPRNGKITMGPLWDFDRTQGSTDGRDCNARVWRSASGDLGTDFFNYPWWNRLFTDPDFWQKWIDRYESLRKTTLSASNVNSLIDGFANQVRAAQPRELARWAVADRTTVGCTTPIYNSPTNGYQAEVEFEKYWYSNRLDFIDRQFEPPPIFGSPGGPIPSGFVLSMTVPPGATVYYTLDGTDPRAHGGGLASNALVYSGPITITNNVRVMARARDLTHLNLTGANNPPISSPWSGSIVDTYAVHTPPLVITEIMYHPPPLPPGNTNDPENFEYIELKNIGPTPLNLIGFHFTNGIDYAFTAASAVTNLAPGDYVLLVKSIPAFTSRYGSGFNIAGEYGGNLDNAGERIRLQGPLDEPVMNFSYNNNWYPTTDGLGFSLVIVDETAQPTAWDSPDNWRPSSAINGSPGVTGASEPPPPPRPAVVVNEILTNEDPPAGDAIELFNTTSKPADISGWFLTDDFNTPKKYVIPPGTVIPAGRLMVFYATNSFGNSSLSNRFGLDAQGEQVYLFSGDGTNLTGYSHGFDFGAQARGVTFGRYIISTGDERFVAQRENTLGAPNGEPLVGPIVISEINYHPPDINVNNIGYNDTVDEYIELQNITTDIVPLFDPAYPTNTWHVRKEVDYDFPTNQTIPAGGFLLLVGFDPAADPAATAAFRSRNFVPSNVPLFGPWRNALNNAGAAIEVLRPDVPAVATNAAGFVTNVAIPYILVDRVNYSDMDPWPSGADGFGLTLQRIVPASYGDDPANWVAVAPSPGDNFNPGAVPPSITSQSGNRLIPTGSGVSLTVSATGSPPLRYQWRFDGLDIYGANAATLLLPGFQFSQAGIYNVLVYNSGGSVLSTNISLVARQGLKITSQPVDRVVTNGSTASFTNLAAIGTGTLRYQWHFNGGPVLNASNGTTSSILVLTNVQVANNGAYDCAVSDDFDSTNSLPAMLTVLIPPRFAVNPQSQIVALGSNATFNVSISGSPPLIFRWRRPANLTNGFFNGFIVNGSNDSSLTLTNIAATNAATYTVAVSNIIGNQAIGGGQPGLSSNAYLYVIVPPTNQTAQPGSAATFSAALVGNTNVAVRYQWQAGPTPLPGATNATLTLSNVQPADAGVYSVVVTITTNAYVPPSTFLATLQVVASLGFANPRLMPDGSFQGTLSGQVGQSYILEISSNLTTWTPLATFSATNAVMPFVDVTATNANQRFYRFRTP